MSAPAVLALRPPTAQTGTALPVSSAVSPARFAGLDGLRAIAVGAVLLFHLTPGALPGGYIGVDLFFVISGFLITALLLQERERSGRIDLAAFWRRRARRLLPALGVLLLVCCSAAWVIGGDVLVGLGRQVLGALTFSSNWQGVTGAHSYFDETSPELFRNLWSLAVEEQFYLLWPLAVFGLLLFPRRGWRLAAVAAVAAASALAMAAMFVPGDDATRVYYGTDTHSFGLSIGALLAFATARWPRSALGWARSARFFVPIVALPAIAGLVLAIAFLPADGPVAFQGGLAAVSVLAAIAIAGSIVPGSLVGRALDAKPIAWIGERSYGLYLWHWPVFVLVVAALPSWPRSGASGWALGGIALVVTVAAASVSYRFVEQPIRRIGLRATISHWFGAWRLSPRAIVSASASAALLLAGTLGTVAAIAASPVQSDAQSQIEQGMDAVAERQGESDSRPDAAAPVPGAAAPGEAVPLPGGDQITAIGDSVMLASAPELQAAFPGITIDAVVSRQLSQAPELITTMLAQGTLRPVVLIGLGTNGPIDAATLEQLRRLVGGAHQIVVVNVQAPRGWSDGVNSALTTFAQQYRDVELANWRDAIAPQLSLLSSDQIHPGSRGGQVYANAVRDAVQRLAQIPPLLRPNDYGLAPRPE